MAPRSSKRDEAEPCGRGGDIVFPHIEKYLESLETTRDAVLAEMERQGQAGDFPIVGPLVGRMLCLLAKSIGARRIMELRSGFGYSAYWFARALPEDGELILTEGSAQNMAQAREFFRQGGVPCRARFEVGDAFEILDRLPGEFDIIFNDVDKEQYPTAFHKAVPRVRRGGYFISDNMPTPNLYTMILSIRDGVSVSLKLE